MSLPHGPRVIPFLHNLKWRGRFLEFLEYCVGRYGDIFTFRVIGSRPFVVVSHPQAIKEIFTAPAGYFDSGKANQAFRPLLGNNSLLLLDGIQHQQQRKLLLPPFHGEHLSKYGQIICGITQQEIQQWAVDRPFAIRPQVQAITLRIILQIIFGSQQESSVESLNQCLSELVDSFISPFWWQRFSFPQKKQQLDRLVYAQIRQRRQETACSTPDILSLLLSARDEAGAALTDEEIRDELITLIMAGYETTTTAVLWALYWVAKLPQIREKLDKELCSLGSHPAPSEIARLSYLGAVCSETLRIYSITGFTFDRVVKVPLSIMGYQFEPGTVLSPCTYLTHQREDLYPLPKQFQPERFLVRQFSPYEYYPFGGGNRRCIGMAFAQMEIELVLATILSHWHLSLVDDRPVRPVGRGVTLTPPLSLEMVANRPN
jgi:cytochrome P450 family 110